MHTKKIQIKNYKILVPLVMMVVLAIVFSAKSEYFLSSTNIINILREACVPGILAIGAAFVLAEGEIDLSTGAMTGFLAMLCAILLMKYYIVTALAIPLVILAGCLCGLLNAFVISKLHLNSFIVTIAMQNVYRGLQVLISFRDERGNVFTQPLTNPVFLGISGEIGGVYYSIIILLFLVVAAQIVMKKTKLGLNIYAIGSNRDAAARSGVRVNVIRGTAFAIGGACCAVAAILSISRAGAATASFGLGLEFDALCAIIIGGAAVMGPGSGDTSAVAALVGAVFIELLANGITKLDLSSSLQSIVKGSALIFMILVDGIFFYIREKRRRNLSTKKEAANE